MQNNNSNNYNNNYNNNNYNNNNYNNYNNNYNNYNNNNYNNYNNNNNKKNINKMQTIIYNEDGSIQKIIPKWDKYEYQRRERLKNREKITSDGYFKGIKLCGKVRVVDRNPDFRVIVVDSYHDLKVQKVDDYPKFIGQWQFVGDYSDFTIQFFESHDFNYDFKIQFVDSYPGVY
jgi:ABC-type antimicrobial peptide transport system permease subunit